ncbi:MAG: hypothetical protein AMXMBFR72_22560 [Betaproteobacteria bacterium]
MSIHSNTLTASRALRTGAPVLVLAVCAVLAACGGGGYGGATDTTSLAPTITTHPASITVTAGQPASFSVVATNASSYQWQRDGATIMGATAATYTIAATAPSDNGAQFRVVVSNVYGSVTSNPATLTVQ